MIDEDEHEENESYSGEDEYERMRETKGDNHEFLQNIHDKSRAHLNENEAAGGQQKHHKVGEE